MSILSMLPNLPDIWPLFNFINIVRLDESKKSVNDRDSYSWYYELVVRHLRLSTYLIVAYFAYYFTFPSINDDINWIKWTLIIFIRDQFITFLFYHSWHYVLYNSKYSTKMERLKFNPNYPDEKQWTHDRLWTLSGAAISTIFEIFMIYFYKSYGVKYNLLYFEMNKNNLFYIVLWLLFIPYWRDFHFYWIHRLMHRWNWKLFGLCDIGDYLYKYVHSLHHKSYNTGPWSGLSMHPIEHLFYYSCVLCPSLLFIKQHPMHLLFNKWHAQLSPLPGHDGFDSPGGGSYFHYLHHAHFECNYGTPMVPFDKIFGSFSDGSKYRKQKKFDSVDEHKY